MCTKLHSCGPLKICRACTQRLNAGHASHNQYMNAGCWLQAELQPLILPITWTDVARMHKCGILLDDWPVVGSPT